MLAGAGPLISASQYPHGSVRILVRRSASSNPANQHAISMFAILITEVEQSNYPKSAARYRDDAINTRRRLLPDLAAIETANAILCCGEWTHDMH